MQYLLCFLAGFLFASYLIPILDGIGAWFLAWTEMRKAGVNEITNQINIKMSQAASELEEDDPPWRPMGFQLPNQKEEDEDEV